MEPFSFWAELQRVLVLAVIALGSTIITYTFSKWLDRRELDRKAKLDKDEYERRRKQVQEDERRKRELVRNVSLEEIKKYAADNFDSEEFLMIFFYVCVFIVFARFLPLIVGNLEDLFPEGFP